MNFAFLFPGQGSQSVGMLDDLSKQYKVVQQVFKEGSDILSFDFWKLVHKGPEEQLNLTVNTQPAIFMASFAMWKIWNELTDMSPHFMCGHSLGEYSALVCAKAIKFKDALKLVRKRAEIMQAAVPEGKGCMLAVIGLKQNDVVRLCTEVKGVVEVVNFNSHDQFVVAGEKNAVTQVKKNAEAEGAYKAILLPISIPSHSSLMKDAALEFSQYLEKVTITPPSTLVIHNVDVSYKKTSEEIKDALVKQLYSPVNWIKTMKELSSEGVETFVEVGPGRVLSGLARRIDRSMSVFSMKNASAIDKALRAVE